MKKILVWVIIYLVGAVSGVIYNYTTSGARERLRIAALEAEVNAKNDKLDKCTSALIQEMRPNIPLATPPPK